MLIPLKSLLCTALLLGLPVLAQNMNSVRSQSYEVAVLGDVEGQGKRLHSFLAGSGVFTRTAGGAWELLSNKAVVFQGDANDRGENNREILEFWIQLKEKYPDRVTLLIGNRDVFKLALITDLSDAAMLLPNPRYEKWLDDKGLNTPAERSNKIRKLQWIYEKNMGTKEGFEQRRRELQHVDGTPASDQDIVQSFFEDLKPNGLWARYLRLAQLAFVDNSVKTLFVHGSVNEKNLGYVPGQDKKIHNVRDWVVTLNAWAHQQILAGLDSQGTVNGAQDLLNYSRAAPESVVNSRFEDARGYPELPAGSVIESLIAQDIYRISVGHTPTGEYPILARKGLFQLLLTDASYNESETSPIIKLWRNSLNSWAFTPKYGPVQIEIDFANSDQIGLHTWDRRLVIGRSKGRYLLYKLGPNFSRDYSFESETSLHSILQSKACSEVLQK